MDLALGLIFAAVFAPVVAGAATLLIPRSWVSLRVGLALLGPLGAIGLLGTYLRRFGLEHPAVSLEWMPQLQLNLGFHADRLGIFFALLVSGIGLLITAYGRAYFGANADDLYRFFPSLHLFMTAMLGMVLADSMLLMLCFWELTSISSYLLIGWDREDPRAVKSAMQAFIVTGAGGLALLAGLVVLGTASGAWSFSALVERGMGGLSAGTLAAAFVLIYIGAAAKSAQWPLHSWLPAAMAAPTPVSAYLHSATMVKAGVYLMGRLWPVMAAALPGLWPGLIIAIGSITMVLGAYVALRRDELKQIFAYTTVSQLGLLMTMYGLSAFQHDGSANILWDLTQILNHALYKAPLFILAGAIGHSLHAKRLSELGGLLRRGGTPALLGILLLLAAYALGAGPLTLSFTAKELFLYQVWHGLQASPSIWMGGVAAAAVATGMFNVAIFVRIAQVVLARSAEPIEEPDHRPPHRSAWGPILWLPAAILLLGQYGFGLIPGAYAWTMGGLERPSSLNPPFDSAGSFPLTWDAIGHPGVPLYLSALAIGLGLLLGFSRWGKPVIADWHDRLFPAFYAMVVGGGARVFGLFQPGYLPTYVLFSVVVLIGLLAWSMIRLGAIGGSFSNESLLSRDLLAGWLLTGLMCLAAILMTIVRLRVARVLLLGVAGAAAAAIFYQYQAPDLALTQISIEVVSLILFLLVLALLPEQPDRRRSNVAGRLMISSAAAAIIFLLTLGASQNPGIGRLGEYFLRNAYHGRDSLNVPMSQRTGGLVDRGADHPFSFGTHPQPLRPADPDATAQLHKGGGGGNVVNVILVDFRALDTLGEITVLALAALGVWTLLRGQKPRHGEGDGELTGLFSTVILRQASLLIVPLAMLLAAFIFIRGHQFPGGGFIGGLVAAVGLILYRMSYGADALRRVLGTRERTLIAAGLLIAVATGAGAMFFGLPFLTSNNGYLPLPGNERYHWATVLAFDVGVFLVVIGVTVGMIEALFRQWDRAEVKGPA